MEHSGTEGSEVGVAFPYIGVFFPIRSATERSDVGVQFPMRNDVGVLSPYLSPGGQGGAGTSPSTLGLL